MTTTPSTRFPRWLPPVFFAVAAAGVLTPALFGLDPIYGFDTVQEKFFWRSWAYERLAGGEWPWWCAALVGGFPLIAEPITQFWYPPVAILHLLFPIGRALNLTWWIHLSWAGLGMFRLLRRRGISPEAATLGGLTYGLSGWMVGHVPMGGLPHLSSCAWAPWLILSLSALAEQARLPTPRDVALAAVTVAASLLAGHAQFTYGALLFLAMSAPLTLLGGRRGDTRAANEWRASAGIRLLALALALGLGGALAATMLVPYAELLAASNRGTALVGEFADFGARLPPAQLIGAFAPGFFGGSEGVPYWGFPTREAVTPYLGIVPLALALSPVPSRARREAWALRAIGILGLLLAMGPATPVLGWLRVIAPLVDRARHPARWLELTVLAASWLAAWGMQLVLERVERRSTSSSPGGVPVPGGAGLVAVAVLALGVTWGFGDRPAGVARYASLLASRIDDSALAEGDGLRAGSGDAIERARRRSTASSARAATYCAVALGLLAAARFTRQRSGAAAALVGLVLIDLIGQGRREIVPFARSSLPWPSAIAQAAASLAPRSRIATTFPGSRFPFPDAFRQSHSILSRIGQADMHRPLLIGTATPQGGIPTTPARWLRLAVGDGAYDFNYAAVGPRTVIDRLSVGLLAMAPGERPVGPGWSRVYLDEQRSLWRNLHVVPRASLVHRCVALPHQDDVLRVLRDARRDRPEGVAFVAGRCPDGIEPAPDTGTAVDTVRWIASGDAHVSLEVQVRSAALLRLSDGVMPGWDATIDDRSVPVETVDFALRGVVVPPGIHRVEFRYQPTAAWLGIGISAAALALLALLLALPRRSSWAAVNHGCSRERISDGSCR